MSDAKKKPRAAGRVKHGGAREGAGRKATGRVKLCLSVPPDVAAWLAANGKSAAVVRLVRAEQAHRG